MARVQQLQREHLRMTADWQCARLPLQALAPGQQDAFSQDDEAALARFASHYAAHLRSEEDVVYPAAQAMLSRQHPARHGPGDAPAPGAHPNSAPECSC